MIERDQVLFPLRRRVLGTAAAISAALFSACPAAIGIIMIVGGIAYLLIQGFYLLVLLLGVVCLIVGVVLALVGLLAVGEAPWVLLLGGLLLAIGYGLSQLAPALNVGELAFAAITAPAPEIWKWFIESGCYAWSWSILGSSCLVAIVTLLLITLLRHFPGWWRRVDHCHVDCVRCHYRGAPHHHCPGCGADEQDLRPSCYGLLSARCGKCAANMPLLDLMGRSRLRRTCGRCHAGLEPRIGRLPVEHVLVIRGGHRVTGRTKLSVIAGRLIYLHRWASDDAATTASAASHGYLKHLDRLRIRVAQERSGPLLLQIRGLIGLIERGTNRRIRRRLPVPVAIVASDISADSGDKYRTALEELAADMHGNFRRVLFMREDFSWSAPAKHQHPRSSRNTEVRESEAGDRSHTQAGAVAETTV